jgi:hypothetical protein
LLRERLELDAVKHAAHMPEDYRHGLASWINQVLYACYIGATVSPSVMDAIESGRLTFPDSPAEKANVKLRGEVEKYRRFFDDLDVIYQAGFRWQLSWKWQGDGDKAVIVLLRPEWPTGLYTSVALPTYRGETIEDAVHDARMAVEKFA